MTTAPTLVQGKDRRVQNKRSSEKFRKNRHFIYANATAATEWGAHHDPIEVALLGTKEECEALVRSIKWRWALQIVIGISWVVLLSSIFVRHNTMGVTQPVAAFKTATDIEHEGQTEDKDKTTHGSISVIKSVE